MKLNELVNIIRSNDLTPYKFVSNLIERHGFVVVGVHTVGSTNSAYTQKYIICKEKQNSRKEFMVAVK